MVKIFDVKTELIKVNNTYFEKEYAFPDFTGDSIALMLKKEENEWALYGWGGSIDGNNIVALGWECLAKGTLSEVMAIMSIYTDEGE